MQNTIKTAMLNIFTAGYLLKAVFKYIRKQQRILKKKYFDKPFLKSKVYIFVKHK